MKQQPIKFTIQPSVVAMIGKALTFVAKEDKSFKEGTRKALTCVCLDISLMQLTVTACDAHQLYKSEKTTITLPDQQLLIPVKSAKELVVLFEYTKEKLHATISNEEKLVDGKKVKYRKLIIRNSELSDLDTSKIIYIDLANETYPDYNRIIPTDNGGKILISAFGLLEKIKAGVTKWNKEELKLYKQFSKSGAEALVVKLSIENTEMLGSLCTVELYGKEVLAATEAGDHDALSGNWETTPRYKSTLTIDSAKDNLQIEAFFSIATLKNVLETCDTTLVNMTYSHTQRAFVITPHYDETDKAITEELYLIMPVYLVI